MTHPTDPRPPRSLAPWRDLLRPVLAAVQYFTWLPVPDWVGHGAGGLDRTVRWLPLVGVGVGLAGAAVLAAARLGLPPTFAAVLATAATLLLTGALHEDGLADSCDGLFGGWTRDDALRIMKDSRVGSFGAAGLVLVLGAKLAAVAALPPLALVVGHAASRFWAVTLVAGLDYVRAGPDSRAAPAARRLDPGDLVLAGLCGLLPALLAGERAVVSACLAGLVAWGLALWVRRRLGGYTGDVLGLVQQVTELAVYAALLWRAGS